MIEVSGGAVLLVLVVMLFYRLALVGIRIGGCLQFSCARAVVLGDEEVSLVLAYKTASAFPLVPPIPALLKSCLKAFAFDQLRPLGFRQR